MASGVVVMSSGIVGETPIYSEKLVQCCSLVANQWVSCAIEVCNFRERWMAGEYIVFCSFGKFLGRRESVDCVVPGEVLLDIL